MRFERVVGCCIFFFSCFLNSLKRKKSTLESAKQCLDKRCFTILYKTENQHKPKKSSMYFNFFLRIFLLYLFQRIFSTKLG